MDWENDQSDKWSEQSLDSVNRQCGTYFSEEMHVLAEYSVLRTLHYTEPAEERFVTPLALGDFHGRKCLAKLNKFVLSELMKANAIDPVFIANNAKHFATPRLRWFALNPYLAKSLGWKISENEPLLLTDAAGNTMVQSIWWCDGPSFLRDSP